MPPLNPVPATARVVVNGVFSSSGGPWVNIFHVQRTPTGTALSQTEVNAIAAGVRTAWLNNFIPLCSSSMTLGNVTATDLTSSFGLVGSASGNNAGAIATGTMMPPSVAVGISWTQAQHYRGGHPRSYIPGLNSGQLNASGSNLISAAQQANFVTGALAFRTAVNAIVVDGAAALVLVRRIANKQVLAIPIVTPLTGATVDRRVDTQRRRLGKDIA